MAINPISSNETAKMASQAAATRTNKTAETAPEEKKAPAPKQQPVAETVNISSKAKAALEETRESKAEAAKEAAPRGREE